MIEANANSSQIQQAYKFYRLNMFCNQISYFTVTYGGFILVKFHETMHTAKSLAPLFTKHSGPIE